MPKTGGLYVLDEPDGEIIITVFEHPKKAVPEMRVELTIYSKDSESCHETVAQALANMQSRYGFLTSKEALEV